jgi:hypothetical protein
MKLTAIIDDGLIKETLKYSKAKNITEAVKVALNEYIAMKQLKELSLQIKENPLKFKFTAEEIRSLNRQ